MTIKFGNITKTLTGKIRLQRRSKMKTGVLRSSNPYLEILLTINHQLWTFVRDKTTSLPCPSHTLCISQEHTNEATRTKHSQELYNSCTISLIGKLLLLQLINLDLWETVHPPPTPRGVKSSWVTFTIVVRGKKNRSYTVLIKTNKH